MSKDLSPVYAGVQGGHAVAQWLIDNGSNRTWNNEYLIYLYADLEKWMKRLELKGLQFSKFTEPDLGDIVTAIAIENDGRIFRNLKTIG